MEINKNDVMNALAKLAESCKDLATPESVFPKHYYEMFKRNGLTQDEILTLENAELKSKVVELLPKDEQGQARLASAYKAISTPDGAKNVENLKIICEKDPEMMIKLLALTEVFKA